MSGGFHRVRCVDPDERHKSAQYESKKHPFKRINDFVEHLPRLYSNKDFDETDKVCSYCYTNLQEKVDRLSTPESSQQTTHSGSSVTSSQDFLDQELKLEVKKNEIDELNRITNVLNLSISPVKLPGHVNINMKNSYGPRKRKEIIGAVDHYVHKKLKVAFEMPELDESSGCSKCNVFIENVRVSLENCSSYNEKIRLLSIIPKDYTRETLLSVLPNITAYMINKARSVDMYKRVDIYTAHPLSPEVVAEVLKYYLDDDYSCTRQSPNKNDTVSTIENGEKVKKVKRFATRSVNEMYKIFREKNPTMKIGRSKFYDLRPKWVKIQPSQDTCLCVYCENFRLVLLALGKLKGRRDIDAMKNELLSLIACSRENLDCVLQECQKCPGKEAITAASLNLINAGDDGDVDNEEVTYGFWYKGDLQKKIVSLEAFLLELQEYTELISIHQRIKDIQREAIRDIKNFAKVNSRCLVLHGDFAENWSVILKNEIQSYYYKKTQVSIFTAVCYYEDDKTMSFAVVSDDRKHDSAHAIMAMDLIIDNIKSQLNVETFDEIITISDGAASHFKNRFEFHEFKKSAMKRRWIFSATGHGKGACDGVGGLVKHYASNHNLSDETLDFIQNAEDFVSHVKSYTPAITLLLLSDSELEKFRTSKVKDWELNAAEVKGIQKCHYWKSENGKSFIAKTAQHIWREI